MHVNISKECRFEHQNKCNFNYQYVGLFKYFNANVILNFYKSFLGVAENPEYLQYSESINLDFSISQINKFWIGITLNR